MPLFLLPTVHRVLATGRQLSSRLDTAGLRLFIAAHALTARFQRRHWLVLEVSLVLGAVLLLPAAAHAGVGGTEFDQLYERLVSWLQGTPGRIITALAVVVAGIGAVTGNLVGFAAALGVGIVVYYARGIIEGIVIATLPLPGVL